MRLSDFLYVGKVSHFWGSLTLQMSCTKRNIQKHTRTTHTQNAQAVSEGDTNNNNNNSSCVRHLVGLPFD